MKGKAPSAEEKRFHDALCRFVGCIACRLDDGFNDHCSVHHCDGRTKPDAHKFVLPLCGSHHQPILPGVESVHGNKFRFEQRYGTQRELLALCIEILDAEGVPVPGAAREVTA